MNPPKPLWFIQKGESTQAFVVWYILSKGQKKAETQPSSCEDSRALGLEKPRDRGINVVLQGWENLKERYRMCAPTSPGHGLPFEPPLVYGGGALPLLLSLCFPYSPDFTTLAAGFKA